MSGKGEDEPEKVMVDRGGDELHRLVHWEYREGKAPPVTPELIVSSLKAKYLPPFWSIIEELARECDEVLAREGFPKAAELVASGADGQWRYEERHIEPLTECWYAAEIGNLCWHVLQDKTTTHELQLRRIMEIGSLTERRRWLKKYKPGILAKRGQRKTNTKNSAIGGASTAKKAKDGKAVLRELALHPDTVRRWAGKSPDEEVRFLRRLATDYDGPKPEDRQLFTHKGKRAGQLYSPSWFAKCLSDWRGNGDINRALQ
jgi:hypothetical protein